MLKKLQKLSSLGYITSDISLITNLGDLIIKHYKPGKPIKLFHPPYGPLHVDIRTAEFIVHELYVELIPNEYKIDAIVNEKNYKHKNKIDLFINLFRRDLETVFEKKFIKVKSRHGFQYKCKENHTIRIELLDKRTFKKGVRLTHTYYKPIIKWF